MMRKVGFLVAAIALAAFAGAPSDSFAKAKKPKAEQSEQAKTPPDFQTGSRGYRAKKKTTAVQQDQAKTPPDFQTGSRGYRHHKAKAPAAQ
jgi:hypothetical protein